VSLALCVTISVHHAKTLRRVLVNTAFAAFILAGGIELVQFVRLNNSDLVMGRAVTAIAATLLHNLEIGSLVLGVLCVVAAIASKFYPRMQPKSA
jgi:hypothetical protein